MSSFYYWSFKEPWFIYIRILVNWRGSYHRGIWHGLMWRECIMIIDFRHIVLAERWISLGMCSLHIMGNIWVQGKSTVLILCVLCNYHMTWSYYFTHAYFHVGPSTCLSPYSFLSPLVRCPPASDRSEVLCFINLSFLSNIRIILVWLKLPMIFSTC